MKTQRTFIVHPKTTEQVDALKAFMQTLRIKFEVSREEKYDSDFLLKIEESRQQYYSGDYVSIEKKNIKSFLELE